MKLTLCGSIAFINEMDALRIQLEARGHEVKLPPLQEPGEHGEMIPASEYYAIKKSTQSDPAHWIWRGHDAVMRTHFEKIEWADAIVVTNHDKNNITGYIGPNTLMEMGLAFYLHKPIFVLAPLPIISYREELYGVKPIIIDGDLTKIL